MNVQNRNIAGSTSTGSKIRISKPGDNAGQINDRTTSLGHRSEVRRRPKKISEEIDGQMNEYRNNLGGADGDMDGQRMRYRSSNLAKNGTNSQQSYHKATKRRDIEAALELGRQQNTQNALGGSFLNPQDNSQNHRTIPTKPKAQPSGDM